MKPEDYFQPGSVPFIQAQEAINVINAAKAAGLPQAEQYEKSFMSSLDIVRKNNDWSGFDANRQAIAGLAPQINAVAQQNTKTNDLVSSINNALAIGQEYGTQYSPESSTRIEQALVSKDPALLENTLKFINDTNEGAKSIKTEAEKLKLQENIKSEAKQKESAVATSAAIDKSVQFIGLLDKLEKHKGFDNLFGTNVGIPTWVAGSDAADAKVLFNQIDAKGFMEAIKDMKGMGALSNAEGEKASAAFLGLNPSMSEDAARESINEAKKIIKKGIERYNESTGSSIEIPTAKPPEAKTQDDLNREMNSYFNKVIQ